MSGLSSYSLKSLVMLLVRERPYLGWNDNRNMDKLFLEVKPCYD
jgi:hypothetical protein